MYCVSDDGSGGRGGWVKGYTLRSGVYESKEYQRTTAGCVKYEIEGEKREGRCLIQRGT